VTKEDARCRTDFSANHLRKTRDSGRTVQVGWSANFQRPKTRGQGAGQSRRERCRFPHRATHKTDIPKAASNFARMAGWARRSGRAAESIRSARRRLWLAHITLRTAGRKSALARVTGKDFRYQPL